MQREQARMPSLPVIAAPRPKALPPQLTVGLRAGTCQHPGMVLMGFSIRCDYHSGCMPEPSLGRLTHALAPAL